MSNSEIQRIVDREHDTEMAQLGGRRNGNTYSGFPGGLEEATAAIKIATLALSAGGLIYLGVKELKAGKKINEIIHGKNPKDGAGKKNPPESK